jgi:hypothetical protein
MSSPAVTTILKMLESLPVDVQEKVAEHLREYISDLQDEARWEKSFSKTQLNLIAAARQAREQIAQGQASPTDYDQP